MRVLGISGSPRKQGFTSLLLDKSLEGARAAGAQTEKIILNDLKIKPCQECWACLDTGVCVERDDMRRVYEKIKGSDIIIIASPIYFGTITAQLKTMIDRCNSLWGAELPPKKRKGAFLCVAGKDRKEYFKNAKSVIKALFGTIGLNYSKELFVGGLDSLTVNSPKKKEALLKSYELGLSLIKATPTS